MVRMRITYRRKDNNMNEVATVVVTYNRKELLRECIQALLDSEVKSDIYIIDNASTDGTKDYIKDLLDPAVTYKRLKKNIGGAGGFAAGMNYVVHKGYKYIWIMDDDTIVNKDSLTKLLDGAEALGGEFGFLSSTVRWTDGTYCKMNRQTVKRPDTKADRLCMRRGLMPVKAATFVSLLFNVNAVKGLGLPKKEYFIWGDDKEYTSRISDHRNCYNVVESEVVHKMATNSGSNITEDEIGRIDRYFYAYRNDFATARDKGSGELFVYVAGFVLNAIRVIIRAKDNKTKRLRIMLKGLAAGIFFKPKVRYVK